MPPSYKVVVLGESSVGKTSLVHRFTTNKFDLHTSNTIGAAFITKMFSPPDKKERTVKLEIWDTAGQERYRSLTPMYYRNAKVALVCFDMGNFESTFNTAKYWIQQLDLNNSSEANSTVEVRLVGTKMDLVHDQNNNEIQEQIDDLISKKPNIKQFHQTSSKDGTGITELFNQIVLDIDEQFFKSYYERNQDTRDHIGDMLSQRQASISNCC
ncbi:RAB5B Ras-related protein Rab-5B [Candida maltosa Xu316]